MKTKLIIIAVIATALSGCGKKDAQSAVQKGEFKVELLFEHDGCKIYRFTDYRTIYWSDCRGKMTDQHSERNGKNSTKTVINETLNYGY